MACTDARASPLDHPLTSGGLAGPRHYSYLCAPGAGRTEEGPPRCPREGGDPGNLLRPVEFGRRCSAGKRGGVPVSVDWQDTLPVRRAPTSSAPPILTCPPLHLLWSLTPPPTAPGPHTWSPLVPPNPDGRMKVGIPEAFHQKYVSFAVFKFPIERVLLYSPLLSCSVVSDPLRPHRM